MATLSFVTVRDTASFDAVRTLLDSPRTRTELASHSFVFPEHRLLYVETPKVACTSIKAALLVLSGSTVQGLSTDQLPRPFPEAAVHDRRIFPASSLADLGQVDLAEVLTAPGWIRFCLVRDPFSRVFSAWESKVFFGDPGMLDRFQRLGSGDQYSDGNLDIRATFCAFVEDLAKRQEFYLEDMHFRPQCRVIHVEAVPYTDIVRLDEMERFLVRLGSHLGQPIVVPRVNEGLGIPWQQNYDARAISLISELYAEDVARFDFPVPATFEGGGTRLDPIATNLLEQVRKRIRLVAALYEATDQA